MKSSMIKLLLLSSTTLLLACSTPLRHVIVSPELNIPSSNAFAQKQVQLGISDLRSANHIVQILRTDKAAELFTPQHPMSSSVEKTLVDGLKANGLNIQPMAGNKIEVIIDNAMVTVQQELLKYGASTQIEIRIVIDNAQGSLTKVFKIAGNSNGPFKADLAVLERDFNQQLSKLLAQIVQSEELQQYIQ